MFGSTDHSPGRFWSEPPAIVSAVRRRAGPLWWIAAVAVAAVGLTLFALDSCLFWPALAVGGWWVLVLVGFRYRLRLLSQVRQVNALGWRDYEKWVRTSYERLGWHAADTRAGADDGVDVVLRPPGGGAVEEGLHRGMHEVLVQVKHHRQAVGVAIVRELAGVVAARADEYRFLAEDDRRPVRGLVVASNGFTPAALAFGRRSRVMLVTTDGLLREVHEYEQELQEARRASTAGDGGEGAPAGERWGARMPMEADEAVELGVEPPAPPKVEERYVWEDEQGAGEVSVPACPVCGAAMVERVATRGRHRGEAFWGCSTYPECRGKRAVEV